VFTSFASVRDDLLCAAVGNPADVCSKSEQFMEKSYSSLRKLLCVARENQNFLFVLLNGETAACDIFYNERDRESTNNFCFTATLGRWKHILPLLLSTRDTFSRFDLCHATLKEFTKTTPALSL
jgi:hypothetical protein